MPQELKLYHRNDLASAAVATTLGLRGFGLHGAPDTLSGPEAALLAIADPGLDSRIAILAPGALEMACALMRRGHSDVSIVRMADRPRPAQADIVIIPDAAPADLPRAMACARRMLAPLGTVVITVSEDAAQAAVRDLLLQGLTAIRTRTVFGCVVLRVELPLHGRLQCA